MKLKKILMSVLTIALVAVVAFGATRAFFSDTETSTNNRLVAGAIDLQIDNTSYAIDWNIPNYFEPTGKFVANDHASWSLRDLTVERFFDLVDLKPGDYGEDTISVHVNDNEAWLCAAARITDDNDNTYNEPEKADDDTVKADPKTTDGELDEEVNFAFWIDDGDNVYENDEEVFLSGPISGLGENGRIALADVNTRGPLPVDTTLYIGKYWCFGEMVETPVADEDTDPVTRGATGFTCSGASVDNAAQTDMLVGDLMFYAEQYRNNPNFSCSEWTPQWPEDTSTHRLVLENKNPQDWDEVIRDGRYGVLTWAGDGNTFDFSTTFKGYGLDADTEYALIYAPDPWPQGIGSAKGDGSPTETTELGTGTSDGAGNLTITGNVNLGYDLPHPYDDNYPDGAKIWLVLADDHSGQAMTAWHPTEYLFETVLIQYDDLDAPEP